MKRLAVVVAAMALVLSVLTLASPGTSAAAPGDQRVDVIVQLAPSVGVSATSADHERLGVDVQESFRNVFNGYVANVAESAIEDLRADPRVLSVEVDQAVHATAQSTPPGIERIGAASRDEFVNEADDVRVDVDVAVLDTGIDGDHPDLNVVYDVNCLEVPSAWWWGTFFERWFGGPPAEYPCQPDGSEDGDSHGTHVAGTIAALDNGVGVVGVAPGARLWNVKVLDNAGDGTISSIIRGLDHVVGLGSQIEVVNMSLGCVCQSSALDTAIANTIAAGVVVVASAGNNGIDIANTRPGGNPDVIGVSAFADYDGAPGGNGSGCATPDDTRASFSNYGTGVAVAAPGVCIRSTVPGGAYGTKSGTSMSSPHVAGAAALLASADNPNNRSDVLAIRAALVTNGVQDWVDNSGDGVLEPRVNVAPSAFDPSTVAGTEDPPPGNQPPTASFTVSCDELECTFDASGSSDDDGVVRYDWVFGDSATSSDGPSVATHTYASPGTYTVGLTVFDAENLSGSTTRSAQPFENQPPTASFTVSCNNLTCSFNASGSSDDGGIVSYTWDFGDSTGTTEGDPNTSHTYASAGSRTVTLTVEDGAGLDDSTTRSANPTDPPAVSITADVVLTDGFFIDRFNITWSGATTSTVDIRRDGALRTTTANDGQFTDSIWFNSRTHSWQVCNRGSLTECSVPVIE
ncbi:MAG: S8 family serine peptidase [Acidimicrobiales bacterium]